jgi:Putative abortive phage resistance protein AbiGi, antitoxin
MAGEHTGSILFHCWRHEPKGRARKIFTSIVERGLLLTTTNGGALDKFSIRDGENELRQIEVMQNARICFTDIPRELLASHGAGYGRYAVGFSRQTVVEWGGCPAWYLPNHHGGETLKDAGPTLLNGLHAAMVALDSFHAAIKTTEDAFHAGQMAQHFFTQQFTHGKTLVGDDLLRWVQHGRNCVSRMLSFVKEMSPPDVEDFRYLYEREWRIVDGIQILGKNPCRLLTDAEEADLCAMNPNWKNPPMVSDINIQARYSSMPLIDSFRIFEGTSETERISHKIEMVLVPEEFEKRFVEDMVSREPASFRIGGPEILLFPT